MLSEEMKYEKELAPYQAFDIPERIHELNHLAYTAVCVIGLNGPSGSGKTLIANTIQSLAGPCCVTVSLPKLLYSMMGECGLPNCHLTYEEFKAQPWGRMALIAASEVFKAIDINIFCMAALATPEVRRSQTYLVIIDNIGFAHELDFLDLYCRDLIMVQVAVPYMNPIRHYDQDLYISHYYRKVQWPNDSRYPVMPAERSSYCMALESGTMIRCINDFTRIALAHPSGLTSLSENGFEKLGKWIGLCHSFANTQPSLELESITAKG